MRLPCSRSPAADYAAALLSLAVLATPASAMLQCDHVQIDGQKFNFKQLGGPHSVVTWHQEDVFEYVNTTYTLDLCAPLKKDGPSNESCPNGARACGIRRGKRPGQTDYEVLDLISIAGELKDHGGGHLDPKLTRLKTSESTADSQKEGVRISLFGGRHQLGSGGREQRAIIEMVCDRSLKGTEGEWSPQDDKYERVPPETEEAGGEDAAGRLRRADEGEVDRTEHQLLKGDANGTALVFDSYGPMADNGDVDVLRLTWRTEYACEGNSDAGSGGGGSEHWGFFTWVFFLVFLGTAAYLIFGSWLNYNRYGARGWDLLPHGDSIRDIPYLLKDWTRRVLNTVQGTGSRGGYSAV